MIILGAGLAGLSAAYHGGGTVYEQHNYIGGHSSSKNIDGFVFDEGIHVLQTKNAYVLNLLQNLGVDMLQVERDARIYSYRAYSKYPFQVHTYNLPWSVRARCVSSFLVNTGRQREQHNYEDWIRNSMGDGFAETFMIPYSQKFWGVHPREMSFEWTGNRVPQPRVRDVVMGAFREQKTHFGSNAIFRYPAQAGFGRIANGLAGQLKDIRLEKRVNRIFPEQRQVEFAVGQPGQETKERTTYDQLLSTLPLPELIKMMDDVPAEVQQAVGQLRWNSIMVVNLGIDRADINPSHWIHFPESDFAFFRISFPSNFAPGLVPAHTSSVQAEVSYRPGNPPDRKEIIHRVEEDLRRAKILRPADKVVVADTVNLPYAYVIFDHNRPGAIKVIHQFLLSKGIRPFGRYGSWAYFWSDEAILSGKKAAELAQYADFAIESEAAE